MLSLVIAGCASAPPPGAEDGGDAQDSTASWSSFVPVAAMVLTHAVCTDPAIRACFDMTDAACVTSVGDAVIGVAPTDAEPANGTAQRAWLTGPGQQAAVAAVQTHPRIKPCGSMRPVGDLRLGLVPASGGGLPCIRLAGDTLPCDARGEAAQPEP